MKTKKKKGFNRAHFEWLMNVTERVVRGALVILDTVREEPPEAMGHAIHALNEHYTTHVRDKTNEFSRLTGALRLDEILTLSAEEDFDRERPKTWPSAVNYTLNLIEMMNVDVESIDDDDVVRWAIVAMFATCLIEKTDILRRVPDLHLLSMGSVAVGLAVLRIKTGNFGDPLDDEVAKHTCNPNNLDDEQPDAPNAFVAPLPKMCDRCDEKLPSFVHLVMDPPKHLMKRFSVRMPNDNTLILFLCPACTEELTISVH